MAGLLPSDKEEKQGQGCVEKTVTFVFNSFDPAAKLNYVIEGGRLMDFQPLGLWVVMVPMQQYFIKDSSSYHKLLLVGAELISLPCPSPDVGTEVFVPRFDYSSLRKAN